MTTPVSGLVSAYTAPTAAPAAAPDAMGKDTFLKLLVAQLKYQNPMSPSDGTEFLAQTAQFTVVEKLDELAKQNAELLSSNAAFGASALIGREVVYAALDGSDVGVALTSNSLLMLPPIGEVMTLLPLTCSCPRLRPVRGSA